MSVCIMEQLYSMSLYTAQDNEGFTIKLSAGGILQDFSRTNKFSKWERDKIKYELS